ncbi:MAG: acyl--CoA ligase [Acidobacteria bacterium]|nr:acyl--CoA ligase [Acidobacteriota bacterium]
MAETDHARPTSLHVDELVAAFLRHVRDRPTAAVAMAPAAQCTFAALAGLADAVAARVIRVAPEPGQLVALAAANGPAFLAGFLAVRLAGHAVLLLDAQAPREARGRAATQLGAVAMLECQSAWPSAADQFTISHHAAGVAPAHLPGIAVVKLTSGSSGTPRGVATRAASVLADESALAETMGFRAADRLLAVVPLSHSYGFTTLALSALVRGLPLVVPQGSTPFAPLEAAARCGATVVPTTPAYLRALVAMNEPPPWAGTVRLVVSAGATLPAAVASQFRRTYGQPVHTFYGSSECGGICYDGSGEAAERGTVGRPVRDVQLSFTPVAGASGTAGLVVVRSPAVSDGYLPAPDARLAGGRFETADLGAWCDGELLLRGRANAAINVRGLKVDPGEVELVVRALAGVDDVVVTGVAAAGVPELVCASVDAPPGRLSYESIRTWCRTRLAEHKVPRSILIVDRIVYSARGKVDPVWLAEIRDAHRSR